MATSERDFEKQRLATRARRHKAAAVAADKADETTPLDDIKPAEPKLTKKERERLAKQGQTEEVLQRQANATASMALGRSKYSWMNAAAAASSPGGGIGTGAGVGKLNTNVARTTTATDTVGTPTAPAGPDKNLIARDRRFGDWREDEGRDAKKIVIRDWIAVLERDGMEKKALAKAIGKLGQPFVVKSGTTGQNTPAPATPSAAPSASTNAGGSTTPSGPPSTAGIS